MVGDPLCGRSHRLGIGRATTIFHVGDADLPALLDKKHAELKRRGVGRRCDVVAAVVGGDGVAAALERAGLDADVPTKWVFAMGALEADSPMSAANSFAMAAALGGAPGSAIAAVCLEPAFAALLGRCAEPQYPGARRGAPGRGGARRRARRRLVQHAAARARRDRREMRGAAAARWCACAVCGCLPKLGLNYTAAPSPLRRARAPRAPTDRAPRTGRAAAAPPHLRARADHRATPPPSRPSSSRSSSSPAS